MILYLQILGTWNKAILYTLEQKHQISYLRLIPLNTYLMVYRSRIYAHQFFVHILHVKVNRVRFSRIQQAADLKKKKQQSVMES